MKKSERQRVGNKGEDAAALYLARHGFEIIARNVARKTGELDIVAVQGRVLHVVEVKTLACQELPDPSDAEAYSPADNLHAYKLRKVARTAEWFAGEIGWEGERQVDGILVWLRARDGMALVRYVPQLL